MRKRHGIFKRSSKGRRTFNGVVYDSLLECTRAQQLAAMQPSDKFDWTPHPRFVLGCPENIYTADFRIRMPGDPWLYLEKFRKSKLVRSQIHVPDGWVEEVKGPVKTGVRRLKNLWKAYGPVPLVILTAVGKSAGSQQWKREVVVPVSMKELP